MFQPTQWFDADDDQGSDEPTWDAGAEGWFRRSVARFVQPLLTGVPAEQQEATHRVVVEWFTERVTDFVFWEDAERYHPEFKSGGWRIDWPSVKAHVTDAVRACAGVGRSDADSIECFLLELDHVGYAELPKEPRAYDLLVLTGDKRTASRQYDTYRRIRARWPRLCCECGREFRGPQAAITRCPRCRHQGRTPSQRNRTGSPR